MTSSFQPVPYQRYARPEGFNPIQTTDIASNIAREGANVTRDMRTQNMSEQNNFRTQAFNERISQAGLDKLADFSQTLTNALIENQKQVNEREKLRGLNDAYINGVPADVQEAFNRQREQVTTDGLTGTRLLNEGVENGAIPWRIARQMEGMSPHRQMGYAQGLLQQLGRQYSSDSILALQEAITQNPKATDAERQQMLQNYRINWLQQTGLSEFNPALLNADLFPALRKAEAQILSNWTNQEYKAINEEAIQDAKDLVGSSVYTPNNWELAEEMIRSTGSYSRSQGRRLLLSTLTPDQLERWAEVTSFDGVTPMGQKFKKDFWEARNNNLALAADFEKRRGQVQALQARNYADQFISTWTGEGAQQPTEQELEAVRQRSLKEFGTYDPRLDKFNDSTVDDFKEKSWRKTLDQMVKDGSLTTPWLLAQKDIPSNVVRDYMPIAEKLSKGLDADGKDYNVEQIKDQIKLGYQREAPKFDVIIPGSKIATGKAIAQYQQRRAALIAGGVDPIKAGEQAYSEVKKRN
jgi:hypothetical protein